MHTLTHTYAQTRVQTSMHTHARELLSIHENIFIRRLSTHSQTYTSQVRDTIAARYTDEEDAAENLHPSFIPSYQDRVLYGDPSKITLHYNVDSSLPPRPPRSTHCPRKRNKRLVTSKQPQHERALTRPACCRRRR